MFRKMLRLAVEAVKVEIDHWRNPVQPETPPVEVAAPAPAMPAPDPSKKRWESPIFHMQVLDSTECPDCGGEKKLKSYRCQPCTTIAQKAAGYA